MEGTSFYMTVILLFCVICHEGVLAMSLLRQGKAFTLTIYIGESDQWQGTSLYAAIIHLLREQGCAGATATRAVAGYGAGARLHEQGGLHWSSDATIVIQIIDQPERVRRLLPRLQEMLNGGLMTLQEVEVLKYTHARLRGIPTKLQVQQVMETLVTTVSPETPAATIVDLLLAASFRAIPVVDQQQHLQGIISTGDLITAGILPMRRGLVRTALELDSQTAEAVEAPLEQARRSMMTAQEVMNRQVRAVAPTMPVREAAQIMLETGLRRLPVVNAQGVLLGMLARADLLQVIVTSPLMSPQFTSATQPLRPTGSLSHDPIQRRPIADFISTAVETINPQASLAEVIDALIVSPFKRVLVVDQQRCVQGIISDIDVLAGLQTEMRPGLLALFTSWASGKPKRPSTGMLHTHTHEASTAADLMNREVVTVTDTTSVQETIEIMIATRRKILPVVNAQGQLVGVVGRSDLLRVLVEG
jgi:CBS-domain-containing membrane protein